MPESRFLQKFINGVELPWFAAGKAYIWGSYANKNDFVKETLYLSSFLKHGKGGGRKISVFNTRYNIGGRVKRSGLGCGQGCRLFIVVWGGHGGRGYKSPGKYPKTSGMKLYTDQEWLMLLWEDKKNIFDLQQANNSSYRISAVKIVD